MPASIPVKSYQFNPIDRDILGLIDGEPVGYFATRREAEIELDRIIAERAQHETVPAVAERNGDEAEVVGSADGASVPEEVTAVVTFTGELGTSYAPTKPLSVTASSVATLTVWEGPRGNAYDALEVDGEIYPLHRYICDSAVHTARLEAALSQVQTAIDLLKLRSGTLAAAQTVPISAIREDLAAIIGDAHDKAQSSPRWVSAIEKAYPWLLDQERLQFDAHGSLMFENRYLSNGTCHCPAGAHGKPCYHRAARRLALLALERRDAREAAQRDAIKAKLAQANKEMQELFPD